MSKNAKVGQRLECANCSVFNVPLLMCGRCMLVQYCSRNCQKQHWSKGGHSKFCIPLKVRKPTPLEKEVDVGAEVITCMICLEMIKGSSACKLPCDHIFHAECIQELRSFGVAQLCPACRTELPNGPEKITEDCHRRFLKLMINLEKQGKPLLVDSLSEEGREEARAIVSDLTVAGDQGHVAAQFNLGVIHFQGKIVQINVKLAEIWFRKAADQNNACALCNLGSILGSRNDFQWSVECYERALSIDPKLMHAHFNLGILRLNTDLKLAIECFRKVVELDPEFAGGFYNLGVAVARSGLPIAAEAYYRRTIKLDNKHSKAFFNLGLLLMEQGRMAEAKPFLESTLALCPDHAEARELLALF